LHPPLEILFEDNHLLVVNKPAGVLVQGDKTGDIALLEEVKSYIKIKYEKPGAVFAGLVHRLDRPTSGCVLFAKTSKALSRMSKQFAAREVKKVYWALVPKGNLKKKATLSHWLVRNTKKNKSYAHTQEVVNAKKAILHYEIHQELDNYCLLEIELETGRHHQIRTQLAAIGSPIKGDLKYGAPRSNSDGSIDLHARRMEFLHPVQKTKVVIIAPPPNRSVWDSVLCD
jgi:23S rRNA pseudouridine1911/1915/1917 synthase